MSFNGNEGSVISLTDAADLTANYRATIVPGSTKGMFVGRNKVLNILNQQGCMGVRIYLGMNKNGDIELVVVGADSSEDDMEQGVIVDSMIRCPIRCGKANSLNS
jgi:hypothetical protein